MLVSASVRQLLQLSRISSHRPTEKNPLIFHKVSCALPWIRHLSSYRSQAVGRNMVLHSNEVTFVEFADSRRPLILMLPWLLSQDKNIKKYADFYVRRGFDVLTVKVTPLEVLFPVSGMQQVARNTLNYLHNQNEYGKIIVHGFSVGSYLFGEMLWIILQNPKKYRDVLDLFTGIVFDSPVDTEGMSVGFRKVVSQHYKISRRLMDFYEPFHMKIFYHVATKHYLNAWNVFTNNFLRCPALMFVSQIDGVANSETFQPVRDRWQANGIEVTWKCWNNTEHVSHMKKYPDEYAAELEKFLGKLGFCLDYLETDRVIAEQLMF